ncbi:DinB family protein [Tessaracoccus palaemonis]|uniref:DinB family protein n=1 Tax=Tessaracoccus palaemonis TaxID=2829499 RepID=A0ABX8SEZ3_9ACTN|nr:DinB family protein [Tessaracoccus palaemonis]QXT61972.1 DinB family protein [Tessaracoccus palaemonis]
MGVGESLLRELETVRGNLIGNLSGLDERAARLPRTPTGTNLAGLVKHCCFIEHGYLVACVGRDAVPGVAEPDFDADPNADLYLAAGESVAGVLELYARVGEAVRASVEALPLDAPGRVPWWGDRGETTLGHLLVHTLGDLAQHAGQADILREQADGTVGLRSPGDNIGEPADGWEAHVARLTTLAEQAGRA